MKAKPLPSTRDLRRIFVYDPATGIVCRRGKEGTPVGYSQGKFKHLCVCVNYKQYYLQRIIWKMVTGKDPGTRVVDHKDGDTHNNRWNNLRAVSKSVNNKNQHRREYKYGYNGVSKLGSRFRAYVRLEGEYKHIGMYATPEEAVTAVKSAELKLAKKNNDTVLKDRASK